MRRGNPAHRAKVPVESKSLLPKRRAHYLSSTPVWMADPADRVAAAVREAPGNAGDAESKTTHSMYPPIARAEVLMAGREDQVVTRVLGAKVARVVREAT